MLKEVYAKYFAPGKMLRHVFQHIEVGVVGYFILWLITNLDLNFKNIFIFLIGSYLPDLDGISSVFIWQSSNEMAKNTAGLIYQLRIKEALSYATVEHKKLNKLIFHNLVAYLVFCFIFIYSLNSQMNWLTVLTAALLTHFTFDFIDDLYQLGNINNWLWPYKAIFPGLKTFQTKPLKERIPGVIRSKMI